MRPRCRRLANATPESVESMLLCVLVAISNPVTPRSSRAQADEGRRGRETHLEAISLAKETPLGGGADRRMPTVRRTNEAMASSVTCGQ